MIDFKVCFCIFNYPQNSRTRQLVKMWPKNSTFNRVTCDSFAIYLYQFKKCSSAKLPELCDCKMTVFLFCGRCTRTFARKSILDVHLRCHSENYDDKRFICYICGMIHHQWIKVFLNFVFDSPTIPPPPPPKKKQTSSQQRKQSYTHTQHSSLSFTYFMFS